MIKIQSKLLNKMLRIILIKISKKINKKIKISIWWKKLVILRSNHIMKKVIKNSIKKFKKTLILTLPKRYVKCNKN